MVVGLAVPTARRRGRPDALLRHRSFPLAACEVSCRVRARELPGRVSTASPRGLRDLTVTGPEGGSPTPARCVSSRLPAAGQDSAGRGNDRAARGRDRVRGKITILQTRTHPDGAAWSPLGHFPPPHARLKDQERLGRDENARRPYVPAVVTDARPHGALDLLATTGRDREDGPHERGPSGARRGRRAGRELRWRFSRSSGPGGQSVNTTDSRVELSLDVSTTEALGPVLRERALAALADRLVDGVLTVSAAEHRSQLQNRRAARARLAALLRDATAPPPRAPAGHPPQPGREGAPDRREEAAWGDQAAPARGGVSPP